MKSKKIKKEGFMKGVLTLMFSQVLIKIIGLVYKWYLTNKEGFGDKGNAIYSAGFSIYALLLTLSSTGVPNAVAKLVSARTAKMDYRGAHRIFKIAFGTFAIIGLIGTLILFCGAKYISTEMLQIPEAELSLVALSPAIFFVTIISVFRGFFNGRQNMKATANSQVIEQIFKTVFTIIIVEFIAICSGASTVIMAAGANLATTFAILTSFLYLYIYYSIRRKDLAKEIVTSTNYSTRSLIGTVKNILFVSIPMSLSAILGSINRNIDSMTVVRGLKKFMEEEKAIKQYGILSGKVDTLISLPLSFNIAFATALVPSITAARAVGNNEVVEKRILFSLLTTILIGLPCMVGMMIFAKPILQLLFPNAPDGEIVFIVSAIGIIFMILEQTVNGALQGIGKILTPAISLAIGVSVKLVLNLTLIPIEKIGIIGASIGTIACHMISFIIGFKILKSNLKLKLSFSKFMLKPLIATFVMGVCSYTTFIILNYCIETETLSIIIAIIVAIIIYIVVIFLLKIFTKEEIYTMPYGSKVCKFLEKIKIY